MKREAKPRIIRIWHNDPDNGTKWACAMKGEHRCDYMGFGKNASDACIDYFRNCVRAEIMEAVHMSSKTNMDAWVKVEV